jgi:mono/diheme cytochrome c family protein
MRDTVMSRWPLWALGLVIAVVRPTAVSGGGDGPEPGAVPEPPTYAGQVAAILQNHCLECHRPGQVGPFPLKTYAQARKRAADIATVVSSRQMPPWKAVPQAYPRFKYERSLSASDIATVVGWAEAGAPEGDPSRVPTPPEFSDEWKLGTPDLVLEMPADFEVPAEGPDIYRCFVIPTSLGEDRYISAIEYRPGNRRVVHHLLGYVDTTGEGRKRDEADLGPGYMCFAGGTGIKPQGDLGGWAPGNEPSVLPEGVGRLLPKGSDVVVQVHYHPRGKPEVDRSRIGIHFSKTPVKQTMGWCFVGNLDFKIPAYAPNVEVETSWTTPADVEMLSIMPHMHQIGRKMRIWATLPGGREIGLVRVDDWDFNWQNTYDFEKPLTLPKGSVVKVVAHYDNTAANPRNPNSPPKTVRWGEATTDEMCLGILSLTKKGQDLTRPGEKDDLRELLNKKHEDDFKQLERILKERREKPATN